MVNKRESDNASISDDDNTRKRALPEGNAVNKSSISIAPPVKKFKPTSVDSGNQLELDQKKLSYVSGQIYKYVPEEDLTNSLLYNHPVFSNVEKTPQLDAFIKNLLEDNNRHFSVNADKKWSVTQNKIRNVMGPLAKSWSALDDIVHSVEVFLINKFAILINEVHTAIL